MITSFTSALLPLPSIRLGRLITNRNYPHECYHDPPGVPEPVICPQKTHRAFASSSSSTLTLRTRLAKMLGARYHRTQTDSIDIFATQAHTYYMDNSETWFSRACADSAVRAFLQEAIEHGDSVYLVVGYLTVVDAAVTVNGGGGGEIRGSTDGETVGVEAGYEGDTVQRSGWDTEGEQVYAVQYRKVRFSMFSSKKGVLGENRWRMYVKRGRKDVDDSVEASLEEKGGMPEGQVLKN